MSPCGEHDENPNLHPGHVPGGQAGHGHGLPCPGLPGQALSYTVVEWWLIARPPDWTYKKEPVPVAKVTVERLPMIGGEA